MIENNRVVFAPVKVGDGREIVIVEEVAPNRGS
jgi:hypothetical protein